MAAHIAIQSGQAPDTHFEAVAPQVELRSLRIQVLVMTGVLCQCSSNLPILLPTLGLLASAASWTVRHMLPIPLFLAAEIAGRLGRAMAECLDEGSERR